MWKYICWKKNFFFDKSLKKKNYQKIIKFNKKFLDEC